MSSVNQFNANTGFGTVSVANPNLDGTGATVSVLTGAIPNAAVTGGSFIRTMTIKAQGATSQGMIRLFVDDGIGNLNLIREIAVNAVSPSGIIATFSKTIALGIRLESGKKLCVSTQNAETFDIFVDAMNYGSCACAPDCNCGTEIQFGSITGQTNISTANSNTDGSGTLGLVFTAPTPSTSCGSFVRQITIKAAQDTTQGMVRLFISDGVKYCLLSEVPIPPCTTNSGILPTVNYIIPGGFYLTGGFSLYASTENSESFNVFADVLTFDCCNCPQ